MRVSVSTLAGDTLAAFDTPTFDGFGSAPEHFEKIAPAYLAPLSDGAPAVLVTFAGTDEDGAEFHVCERHEAIAWRDGRAVGTSVRHVNP